MARPGFHVGTWDSNSGTHALSQVLFVHYNIAHGFVRCYCWRIQGGSLKENEIIRQAGAGWVGGMGGYGGCRRWWWGHSGL